MKTKFDRVSLLPPYVFSEINNLKAKERFKGRDIIDLGMGNPDRPTPKHIVNKMISTVKNTKTHRYSISRGIEGLRKAQREYYIRRFEVLLDKDNIVVRKKITGYFQIFLFCSFLFFFGGGYFFLVVVQKKWLK